MAVSLRLRAGTGQRDAFVLERHHGEHLRQPQPTLPRGHERLPVRDRELDRRERARRQDGGREHHACGRLLIDHEIGAEPEHGGLHHDAKHARQAAEQGGDVVGRLLRLQIGIARLQPALGHVRAHAERVEQRRVATRRLGELVARRRQLRGAPARTSGEHLGEEREQAHQHRPDEDAKAHQGVKQKAYPHVERHPGQIEEGGKPHARHECAHIVQVADRLQIVAGGGLQRRPHDDVEHPWRQFFVERAPDAQQDAPAQHVEQALERKQHEHEQCEPDQRRKAAARQHAIVDLQHEDRAAQAQQIDQTRCDGDADQGAAKGADRGAQLTGRAARRRARGGRRCEQTLPAGLDRQQPRLQLVVRAEDRCEMPLAQVVAVAQCAQPRDPD
jgi:hypothetical protein